MQLLPSDDPPSEHDLASDAAVGTPEEHVSWVFVSHSARDYDAARKILNPHELKRFSRFHIANRAQAEGVVAAYRPLIVMNLRRCAWFIVAVSEAALHSQWVRFEIAWALRKKPRSRILCLILDRSDPNTLSTELSSIRKIDVRPLIADTNRLYATLVRWHLEFALPRGSRYACKLRLV